eukprot:2836678-Prymnesium_polylepis.1
MSRDHFSRSRCVCTLLARAVDWYHRRRTTRSGSRPFSEVSQMEPSLAGGADIPPSTRHAAVCSPRAAAAAICAQETRMSDN